MPVLKNTKHEAFAQGLFAGMSQAEAYGAAGYGAKPGAAESAASRLLKDVKSGVAQRVAELQAQSAKLLTVASAETVEKITGELNRALKMAETQERPDRMVMASNAKAKLNGLIVDKSESTITHKHEDRLARRKEALSKAQQRSGDVDDRTAVH